MSRDKRVVANLALVLAGVVAAFLIAEAVVRIAGLAQPDLYTWAPHRGWGLKPDASGWQRDEGAGFIRVNSAGFRGPQWTVAKPPGTFRIAVIGDSFTEAPQVNYNRTFCAIAQHELGECKAFQGRKVQVMDFGVDAYGTAQELATLRRHVWRYSPDFVVLAFFSGNDLRNNSVVLENDKCRPFYVYEGDKLVLGGPFERSRWFYLSCMLRYESHHSEVLNLIGDAKSQISDDLRAWEKSRAKDAHTPAPNAAPPHRSAGSHGPRPEKPAAGATTTIRHEAGIEDNIYRPPTTRVWKDAWRVTEGLIAMIARDVKAHHARFLAVTLANPPQDFPDPGARAFYMKRFGSTNLFYPGQRIKALGEREGFEVLNLAPPMQRYAQAHHVYLHGFKNTQMGIGHWNAKGQRLAGELIARKICQMMSVAGPPAAAN